MLETITESDLEWNYLELDLKSSHCTQVNLCLSGQLLISSQFDISGQLLILSQFDISGQFSFLYQFASSQVYVCFQVFLYFHVRSFSRSH